MVLERGLVAEYDSPLNLLRRNSAFAAMLEADGGPEAVAQAGGPSFAYSLPVHSFHKRRD